MFSFVYYINFILLFFLNRQIQYFQHYKDHMKLHDSPLQYFCYHLECDQRFLTQQELKDHVIIHQPFRPQCQFTDCEKLFPSLQSLYDHEWRHYIPAPQKDELELRLSRQMPQNSEAPWKQRVKAKDLWLQSLKEQREGPCLLEDEASNCGDFKKEEMEDQPYEGDDHVDASNVEYFKIEIKAEDEPCQINVLDSSQDQSNFDSSVTQTVKPEPTEEGKASVNGYENETRRQVSQVQLSSSHTGAAAAASNRRGRKRMPVILDPLNVRDSEDLSTLSEGVQKSLGEPHITEHKSFQPEDPSYATFVKAPFVRPPPSTYLNESVLSMRKRKSMDDALPRKNVYWSNKKKETAPEKEEQMKNEAPPQKLRTRCDKCLLSFSSFEELQKHQALNTCSALFGFDSDDEGK